MSRRTAAYCWDAMVSQEAVAEQNPGSLGMPNLPQPQKKQYQLTDSVMRLA